jgi:hypothetical protein
MTMRFLALALMPILALPSHAQKKGKDVLAGYDKSARATILHPAIVYVGPDDTAQKVAEVTPGHEMVIVDHSGPWVKVFANTDTADTQDPDTEAEFTSPDDAKVPSSGWIRDKGLVTSATPNGDAILFGAAAELEDQAEKPHAPKDAAVGAHLLYRRVFEYFPSSNLAGESAFRSADIRWQLEKTDISTLPSAKEQEAYLRPQLYEGDLKRVIKRFPQSEFAGKAAYDLIDNKLCGDWQGLPKCPEMEANLYMKYVEQWPASPRAPEAFYNAIYRTGVLVTMYEVQDNKKRAETAAARVGTLAAEMHVKYPNSDFTRRADSLAFRVKQGLSIYGNDRE